jgi:hypothetical protein
LEKFSNESLEITWNPESRLVCLRFHRGAKGTREDAALIAGSMTVWVGSDGKPFGLLADARNLSGMETEYRAIMGGFFKQHRNHSVIAVYNMGPLIRVGAEMFRIGTGTQLKGFATEPEARSWMRKMGITA